MTPTTRTQSVYLVFVCTGNICRSPMAEIIVREALDDAGLLDDVLVRSCGIGGWHVGEPADDRARAELLAAGYDPDHTAAQLGDEHANASLYIAMDKGHLNELRVAGIPKERIRLMRSFDPNSEAGAVVDDPYYGPQDAFTRTRTEIEAATPGLVEWTRTLLKDLSGR